jgi:hypothetical protein
LIAKLGRLSRDTWIYHISKYISNYILLSSKHKYILFSERVNFKMFCCNICGAMTGLPSPSPTTQWLNYTRAIYITRLSYLHPHISGIGYVKYPINTVLVNKSCEALESVSTLGNGSEGVNAKIHSAIPIAQSDGTLNPAAYTTGFVVHKNCWQLLEWACYPTKVSVETMNLFLRSFEVLPHGQLVDWGHGYGGLHANFDSGSRTLDTCSEPTFRVLGRDVWKGNPLLLDDEYLMSKLNARIDDGSGDTETTSPSKPHLHPNHISIQTTSPSKPHIHPNNISIQTTSPSKPPIHSNPPTVPQSPLEALSTELLDQILTYLPTPSVLSLRLSSRTISNISLSKAFWRSRFAPGAEYSSVIEPWLYKADAIFERCFADPRAVYEVIKQERRKGNVVLDNRKRVWELIGPLADALVSFTGHEKMCGGVEPAGEMLASVWESAGCDTYPQNNSYSFGSLPCFKRYVALPKPVHEVRISVLRFHAQTYITGLRFCFTDGSKAAIGYILTDCEVTLATEGGLRGFEVATGERGIHGIGVIGKTGVRKVAGEMAGTSLQTLGHGGEVTGIKAEIDVSCGISFLGWSVLTLAKGNEDKVSWSSRIGQSDRNALPEFLVPCYLFAIHEQRLLCCGCKELSVSHSPS